MRIIVVPILRGNWGFFCHSTHPPTGRIAKWVAWSAVKWENLGKEPAGTMKKKLHIYGTKLIDQVDHEERFLKIVPTKEDVTDKQLLVRLLSPHYKAFKGAEHLLNLSDEGRINFKAEAFLNCAVKRRDPGLADHSDGAAPTVVTDGQTGKARADLRGQALDDSCLLHIAKVFRELAPTLGLELEQARAQVIQRERETSAKSKGQWRKPRRKSAARNVVWQDVETFEDEGQRSVEEQNKHAARGV
ncbi:MAG: hypothetical protein BJ554DRAFT_4264 [Olpidium bornovanus]|uniref:Uncharacterized protein n=1 Tax=Olpidium bornovanus TaxID=278681 RepID=A0A8H7ZNA0_9FUNG|nr:MAG: hypothetical protein BJ554DRAFT_4264 [Olpidium bornovanus]